MSQLPAAAGGPRRARWLAVAAVGVVAAGLGAAAIAKRVSGQDGDEQGASEPTAWENRIEMDQVLLDTASLLGIEPQVQEQREAPVGCVRRDGHEGVSYFLHEVRGEPLADPRSALAEVAESWTDAGYAVSDVGQASELWRLTAETQDGAPISVGTGPGGTVLSGETGCFAVDGAPASD